MQKHIPAVSSPGSKSLTTRSRTARVVLVAPKVPPAFGGAGHQWYRLALWLRGQDQLAFLLTHDWPTTPDQSPTSSYQGAFDELDSSGSTVRIPLGLLNCRGQTWAAKLKRRLGVLGVVWRTGRCLVTRRLDYDVVHVAGSAWLCVAAIAWSRLLRKKTIYRTTLVLNDDLHTLGRNERIKYLVLSRASTVIGISPQLVDLCNRCLPTDRPALLIPDPRDTDVFCPIDEPAKRALRVQLGLPVDAPVVLFVGAIIERKGADLIPEIFKSVLKEVPTAVMLIVGPDDVTHAEQMRGSVSDKVRRDLAAEVAADSVIFTGTVDHVEQYMKACDVLLFPSRREGLPNVPIEAMACGLPAVVGEIPGVTDYFIESGIDGFIVESGSVEGFSRVVCTLLSSPDLRREIGARARGKVTDLWSCKIVDAQYQRLYNDSISHPENV